MTTPNNSKTPSFSVPIGIIIGVAGIIILLSALGFGAFYISQNVKSNRPKESESPTNFPQYPREEKNQIPIEMVFNQTYNIAVYPNFSVNYPSSWRISEELEFSPQGKDTVILKNKNMEIEIQFLRGIGGGGFPRCYQSNLDQSISRIGNYYRVRDTNFSENDFYYALSSSYVTKDESDFQASLELNNQLKQDFDRPEEPDFTDTSDFCETRAFTDILQTNSLAEVDRPNGTVPVRILLKNGALLTPQEISEAEDVIKNIVVN